LKKLGYVDVSSPSSISIYPKDFESKEKIAALIAEYNAAQAEDKRIVYTDTVAILMSSVTTIVDAISYVLIAFVAISLVVSSIMIGVITYISVLERTKEIGVLRSIGASKRDISRVFNAETMFVGLVAGVLGILCSLGLIVIINIILNYFTGLETLKAVLEPAPAFILIAISVVLTLVAGLVPSKAAANKDPVVALRTE
jgi:putative ABC transport system permease protein